MKLFVFRVDEATEVFCRLVVSISFWSKNPENVFVVHIDGPESERIRKIVRRMESDMSGVEFNRFALLEGSADADAAQCNLFNMFINPFLELTEDSHVDLSQPSFFGEPVFSVLAPGQ